MKAPVNSRYAHCDGVSGIAYYNSKGKIITCGGDGEIRMWKDKDPTEDQDPTVFTPSDTALSICCFEDTLYAGTENNCVEIFALPSGEPGRVVAKFTAGVNHVDVSKSGEILVAGSGDMTLQIVKLQEGSSGVTTKIEGHTAPVLSVLADPKDEYVLSTGCDGSACLWNLGGKLVKRWDNVCPPSNDILTSKTLCRPSWRGDGEVIGIPNRDRVIMYERGEWEEWKSFRVEGNKMISVVLFSPCQKYLGAGTTDGTLFIWNLHTNSLIYENAEAKDHITALLFSKCSSHLYAVDMKGRLISVNDFAKSHESQQEEEDDFDMEADLGGREDEVQVDKDAVAEKDDPFDDDDMFEAIGDNEISIFEIKARAGFILSENNRDHVYVGVDKAKKMVGITDDKKDIDDDDPEVSDFISNLDRPSSTEPHKNVKYVQVPSRIPFTEPQPPFQPSSSPEHLEHRFMVWNSIGIIRNYEIEDDDLDMIDIEFHDVSFHNGISLRNHFDYTMAALGKEAVVFASRINSNSDGLSKIMCLHFSSWENSNKEWTTELPKDEEATTAAIGTGWFAVGTNMNRLRIFTVGGVQRNIIDVGGQIIAISGHEDLLMLTFHSGIGLHGNQAISYSLLRIRNGSSVSPLISSESLPLTPKSQISWLGFSEEGTPAVADSKDIVRILQGRVWTTFLCMKEEGGGNESDRFWVTGLSVCGQHVRAIKCRGTKYPPTLPRPTIMVLDAKLPLCEMDTDKSQLEDIVLRSMIQAALSKKMDKKGYDTEEYRNKADKDIKENLMKLFAMCCKADKDFRASEYVTMMPSTHSIQVAIKYASKLRKMALTDRLMAVGRKRLDEEEEGVEDFDDDFENVQMGNVIYSSIYSNFGRSNGGGIDESMSSSMFGSNSFSVNVNQSSASEVQFLDENPLLTRQRAEIQSLCSNPGVYKNPFKKGPNNDATAGGSNSAGPSTSTSSTSAEPQKSSSSLDNSSGFGKGLSLIDAWKKPAEKPTMEFNPKHPKGTKGSKKGEKEKKGGGGNKDKKEVGGGGKKQQTLFAMAGRKSDKTAKDKDKPPQSPAEALSDENSNSNLDSPVTTTNGNEEEDCVEFIPPEKKRKRSGDDKDDSSSEDKKAKRASKLAAFSKRKNNDEDAEEEEDLGDV